MGGPIYIAKDLFQSLRGGVIFKLFIFKISPCHCTKKYSVYIQPAAPMHLKQGETEIEPTQILNMKYHFLLLLCSV